MKKSKLAGETLTMVPGESAGMWVPRSARDADLIAKALIPRDGDPVHHPGRDDAGFLLALCASRGMSVLFDASAEPAAPPLPRRGRGRGHVGKV